MKVYCSIFFQTYATIPAKVIKDLENKKKWANHPTSGAYCPYQWGVLAHLFLKANTLPSHSLNKTQICNI